MTEHRILKGQCMCGAVHYEVADAFSYAMNCHCAKCRQTTGSAFKPMGGIETDQLRIVAGPDNLLFYGNGLAKDIHCRTCGSLLYSLVREGHYVHVPLGTLVDDPTIRPTHHIFVGSKAPWFEITDNLPQFDGFD
tara:strand:+ start:164026 stop:164430 length:405 start_codon:yes stop_codon:yes gene_type:complete